MQTLLNNILQYVDIYQLEKKLRKIKYDRKSFNINDLNIDYKTALKLDHFLWHCKDFDYLDIMKSNNRDYARIRRIRKRINKIFNDDFNKYFILLTFEDCFLYPYSDIKTHKTFFCSKASRRKYVQRYLLDRFHDYVANYDEGGEKGREHYHVVCSSNLSLDILNQWSYGFISIKKINVLNSYALSKYINKLSLHAIKIENKPIFARHKKNNVI